MKLIQSSVVYKHSETFRALILVLNYSTITILELTYQHSQFAFDSPIYWLLGSVIIHNVSNTYSTSFLTSVQGLGKPIPRQIPRRKRIGVRISFSRPLERKTRSCQELEYRRHLVFFRFRGKAASALGMWVKFITNADGSRCLLWLGCCDEPFCDLIDISEHHGHSRACHIMTTGGRPSDSAVPSFDLRDYSNTLANAHIYADRPSRAKLTDYLQIWITSA